MVVVGAGPAGSVAALLLARFGIPVTLVEQHRFPRHKVCGECISALGIEVLHRSGLAPSVRDLHPAILRRAILFADDGSAGEIALPRPMWGISRAALDTALLAGAEAEGVALRQPARCEQVDSRYVVLRDLGDNRVERLVFDYLLVADGKGSLLDSSAPPTRDFGLKAHFRGVDAPRDAIELFGVRGHYGGVAPIEGGLYNIAFSVPGDRLQQFGRDLDGLFARIIDENRALVVQMRRAQRVGDWLVAPLPRFDVVRDWPDRVIPIGNAAAAIEPIGGEGMGLAMRSAELAVMEHVLPAIQSGSDLNTVRLRKTYRRLWNMRRLVCRAAAIAISHPAVARTLAPIMSSDAPLTAWALQALEKS